MTENEVLDFGHRDRGGKRSKLPRRAIQGSITGFASDGCILYGEALNQPRDYAANYDSSGRAEEISHSAAKTWSRR